MSETTHRTCKKDGFEMEAKVIGDRITLWTCPFGHRFTEWGIRPSATFPSKLERKNAVQRAE